MKRTSVFLEVADGRSLKEQWRNAQRVPAEDRVITKRPDPEESIGEVSGNRVDLLLQRL